MFKSHVLSPGACLDHGQGQPSPPPKFLFTKKKCYQSDSCRDHQLNYDENGYLIRMEWDLCYVKGWIPCVPKSYVQPELLPQSKKSD